MRGNIWKIRQYINLRIFGSKSTVLYILRILSILISLVAISAILYYHGYSKTPHVLRLYRVIMHISFGFYFFKFLLRFFYDFQPAKFLRNNWFEALIMFFIMIEGLGIIIFSTDLTERAFNLFSLGNFTVLSTLFVQLYFFIIVGIELGQASQLFTRLKLSPQVLLALSFLILISAGTFLISLPEMTVTRGMSFIDALFTSASASCVTGLIVVDTASFFTLKGKIIILLLIQLGGLNILSFATLFATFYRTSSSIRYKSLIKDFLSTETISDTRILLREIFIFSIIFEVAGMVLLYFSWDPGHAMGNRERLFYALFHSVSAFNNAGFSLFTGNLYQDIIRGAFSYHLIIALLVIFGGIGFMNITNIGRYFREKYREKKSWAHMNVSTRIAVYTSITLILAGMAIFLPLEWNRSVDGYTFLQKLVTAFFQSVTTRTAGFNTVDISSLTIPVLMFVIFLMYIGASPGSTGGGIKTTTFALIVRSALATIRGEENVVFFKRTVPYSNVGRAYSIILFSFTTIFVSTFLLSITEPDKDILSLLFEEVSAISTVGLSLGITSHLTLAGKLIITLSMFVGRIGTMTIALILARKVITTRYKYAETSVVVG